MEEGIKQFNRCWKEFKDWYSRQKKEDKYSIWNLSDFKFHLARICMDKFEGKSLHLDIFDIIPWKRVSLIFCEPFGMEALLGKEQKAKIDLAVDIIYGDNFPKNSNRADHELFVLRKTLEFFDLEIRKTRIKTASIIILNGILHSKKQELTALTERYPKIQVFYFRAHRN